MEVFHLHKDSGFWCINAENPSECADFEVRFCCPKYKTGECEDLDHSWTGWYNDEWDKKNERLWVSARQELEMLQTHGDGAACANPTQSQIRVRPTGSRYNFYQPIKLLYDTMRLFLSDWIKKHSCVLNCFSAYGCTFLAS